MERDQLLTSRTIEMLTACITQEGKARLSAIEVERFLNAVARAQLGVPTGIPGAKPE